MTPARPDVSKDLPPAVVDRTRRSAGSAVVLSELLRRFGGDLLSVANTFDADRQVSGLAVYDSLNDQDDVCGSVLLAVGSDVASPASIELVTAMTQRGAAAVVFRTSGPAPIDLVTAADDVGAVLLVAPVEATWVHLATMLRVSISAGPQDAIGGVALGDLFGFANALAEEVGGSVTVEDEYFRLMAYSSVTDDIDEPRKQTILGRHVPDRFLKVLQRKGVLQQLAHDDDVVAVEAVREAGLRARLAVGVRAGGELLGFIWVADQGHPLHSDAATALRRAAQAAALHIMHYRRSQRAESEIHRELLQEVLEGRGSADVTAAQIGLHREVDYVVLAVEAADATTLTDRLLRAVELYCSMFTNRAQCTNVGTRVYAVIPGLRDAEEMRRFSVGGAKRIEEALHVGVRIAYSAHRGGAERLAELRREADRAMRVLLHREDADVAGLEDVRAEATVLELLDVMRQRPHLQVGKLRELVDLEYERSAPMLRTLRAYIDHFGDVAAASQAMVVHPNTFRYRLRRAVALLDVDLTHPEERLVLALQLRLDPRAQRLEPA